MSPDCHEQAVEVGLGPNPTFPANGANAFTRKVLTDEVVTAVPASRRKTRKRPRPKPPGPPPIVGTLRKAIEWRRQLDAGELPSQAAIARREGVTRARVTQVLALLRLPNETRETILRLSNDERTRGLSERVVRTDSKSLRNLVKFDTRQDGTSGSN